MKRFRLIFALYKFEVQILAIVLVVRAIEVQMQAVQADGAVSVELQAIVQDIRAIELQMQATRRI